MRTEELEIYSDTPNAAVIKHPGRKYPGVLVQGDTLHSMVEALESVAASDGLSEDQAEELAAVRERLSGMLAEYVSVLAAHNIELPFKWRAGS